MFGLDRADLGKLSAEAFTKSALTLRRQLHSTRPRQSAGPSVLHAMLANQRADHPGDVWPALAPIETWSAEDPS